MSLQLVKQSKIGEKIVFFYRNDDQAYIFYFLFSSFNDKNAGNIIKLLSDLQNKCYFLKLAHKQLIIIQENLGWMQETDVHNKNQTSMFQSLLHRIEMNLTQNNFFQQPDILQIEQASPRENSLRSVKSSPRKWAFQEDESYQPAIEQMIDFLTLEQNRQLERIQTSRMDQQTKISKFLSHHRIKITDDSDDSRQKHLKDNLNLSPRKKKRIDKQKIKIPKFKLQ